MNMMTKYVLGVDGGGTKTDYLLFDTEGSRLAWLRDAGSNHEGMPGGMADMETLLRRVLLPFLQRNGLAPEDLSSAAFGMSGIDVPRQKLALEAIVSKLGFRNYIVMNDSFLGIKAGTRKGYGVCVVNGTGNTVGGIDRKGDWLQVAGTGWVSGEDGGSGRIAESALRAVYEELFCLGQPTAMKPLVMDLLRISDPVRFIEALYDRYRTGTVTAREILEVLFRCGNEGDAVALGILRRVGAQIARCVAGCAKRLDFGDNIDVVLVGSVTLKASCPVLLDTLKEETVRLTGKHVTFIPLSIPAAAGAALWGIELALGVPAPDATFDRVIAACSGI